MDDSVIHYHIGFSASQLPEPPVAVLLSGDPNRTNLIAQTRLTDAVQLSGERGLNSWFGRTPNGRPVLASTSGMGAPSMSIIVNELVQVGVRTVIRIGTCGSLQPHVPIGSVAITSASLCLQGAANDIAPVEFPSAADPRLVVALDDAAQRLGVESHVGVTASLDTFYEGQGRSDSSASGLQPHLIGRVDEFARLGVINMEMEAGTLLKMGLVYGFRAACVAAVIAARTDDENPDLAAKDAAVAAAINVAIATVEDLPTA